MRLATTEAMTGATTGKRIPPLALVQLGLAVVLGGAWTATGVGCMGAIGLVMAPVGVLAGQAVGLLLSTVWLGEPMTLPLGVGSGLSLGGAGLAAVSGRRA